MWTINNRTVIIIVKHLWFTTAGVLCIIAFVDEVRAGVLNIDNLIKFNETVIVFLYLAPWPFRIGKDGI